MPTQIKLPSVKNGVEEQEKTVTTFKKEKAKKTRNTFG
jgi:hypothetical protein